jgi:NADH-quinone oxidoreductase subunit L
MDLASGIRHLVLAAAEHAEAAEHVATVTTAQRFVNVSYLWLIPVFPLMGSALNAFLGKRIQAKLGKAWNSYIAVGAMTLAFVTAFVAWIQIVGLPEDERYLRDLMWNMFTAGDLQVNLSFALDPLSMMMTLIITFIGTLIHVYSIGYMAEDPAYWRFFCYLNLFVFSMLLLVMGDNFVLMFFGWEGVGLCSYLLIGFWYEDLEKARAAVKAFVANRFGDFGFVLGLFMLFWALGGAWKDKTVTPPHEARWHQADPHYKAQPTAGTQYERDPGFSPQVPPAISADIGSSASRSVRSGIRVGPTMTFRELRDQVSIETTGVKARLLGMTFFGMPLLALIGILLFVGATAKSAQIPLYVWLPDAMAGPTPVSALIHAATMVTAGVYMVARLNFIFALSPVAMTVIACTGAATAIFAASIGFVQTDIKKVLAYSTVSQLGFMFIGVGVGAYWAGVYHLLTHAFFKACLFLGSGSVILGCHHEQDMRKMGGLKKYMPITEKTYLYACIAIAGFPIANGFFSKDEILGLAFSSGNNLLDPMIGKIIWFVGWIAACGTSFYMWRSYYMTFTGEYRGAGGHDESHGALATHSVGAAHAATFDHDTKGHAAGGHGHGGLPHESPRTMTYVLATLAIGCALTVVLGFWAPLGKLLGLEWLQEPLLERWLSPVLAPSAALVHSRAEVPSTALEWALIIASIGVAFLGWGVARAFYKDAKSTVPARIAAAFPRIHQWVYDKYYVDEFYQQTLLSGTQVLARALSAFDRYVVDGAVNGVALVGRFVCNIDGAIDKYLVDGAVNLFADAVIVAGKRLRRLQDGKIQHYLYAAMAGALIVIGINIFLVR